MPGTVVIIDDQDDFRAILRDCLEEEGYSVLLAGDGESGLSVLRDAPRPCVALMDLMMPVISGWDLIAAMRADVALSTIPVIVLTGAYPGGQAPDLGGAAAVLRKPVDPYDLFSTLEKVMPMLH